MSRPTDGTVRCISCGSETIESQTILEHTPCGCVRQSEQFHGSGGLSCPECPDDGKFEGVAILYSCESCGRRFDGRESVVSSPTVAGVETADGSSTRPSQSSSLVDRISLQRRIITVGVALLLVLVGIGSGFIGSPILTDGTDRQTEPHWKEATAIVVFRNDDIQADHRSETMRAVDDVFVETGVPVTNGVIPSMAGADIRPNSSLCRYLRQQESNHPELFEYSLHGYTHEQETDWGGKSEFGGLPHEEQLKRLRQSQAVFEDCLGYRPNTFVPPFDTYDNATVRALQAEGYGVVSGSEWFTTEHYGQTGIFESGGLTHIPSSQSFVENWSTAELHSTAELTAAFDRAYRNNSVYVQMLHYPNLENESDRQRLRSLIQHMKSREGVAFMTVGEVGKRLENDTLQRTDDGWRIYVDGPPSERRPLREWFPTCDHSQVAARWSVCSIESLLDDVQGV